MADELLIDNSDREISILTLNRPEKRNALNLALMAAIADAVDAAAADIHRRVIVLAASGPSFCAGLDLHEAAEPSHAQRSAGPLRRLFQSIATSPLITIASAHGAAMGGGAGILVACDFVVAAPDLRIAYPEVHRGLIAAVVTALLRRQVSDRQARELLLLGQPIDAKTALAMGLINRVAAPAALGAETLDLARQSCAGAPGAIARTKLLLDDLADRPIAEQLLRAQAYHEQSRDTAEAEEGIRAFREKRKPRWPPRG